MIYNHLFTLLVYEALASIEPAPFPLDPYYVYKKEVVTTVTSRYVGINWGWDGSYMENGEDVIWIYGDLTLLRNG